MSSAAAPTVATAATASSASLITKQTTMREDQEWMMAAAEAPRASTKPSQQQSQKSTATHSHQWATVIDAVTSELRSADCHSGSVDETSLTTLGTMIQSLPFESLSSLSLEQQSSLAGFLTNIAAFYSMIATVPLNVPHIVTVGLMSHLATAVTRQPSELLLARVSLLHGSLSAVDDEANQWAAAYCVWSTLSTLIDRHSISDSKTAMYVLANTYRLCASFYPSTLSLIARYGDQTGTVVTAIDRVKAHVHTHYIAVTNTSINTVMRQHYSLLCSYAFPLIEMIVLVQSPNDSTDYNINNGTPQSQSRANKSSPQTISASKLTSFPILISEAPFYLPHVPPFHLSALSDEHPDLSRRSLAEEASRWVDAIIAALIGESAMELSLFRYYAMFALQFLLMTGRQRSDAYHNRIVPTLLTLYKTLSSAKQSQSIPIGTLGSSLVTSALYQLKLGLFNFYRLLSCAHYWDELFPLLTKPSGTLVALNTVDLSKQKRVVPSSMKSPSSTAATTSVTTIAEVAAAQAESMESSRRSTDELNEIIDISSPIAIEMFRVLGALSLPLQVNLLLSSMNNLSTERFQALHAVSQQASHTQRTQSSQLLFVQTLAAMQGAQAQMAAQQPSQPTVPAPAASTALTVKPSSITAPLPPLNVTDLSMKDAGTLARSSYVRILSLLSEQELTAAQHSTLRAILLTKLSTLAHSSDITHTIGLPSTFDASNIIDEMFRDPENNPLYQSLHYESSMVSSADYQALLTYVLSDMQHRYSVAVRWCYQLLFVKPNTIKLVQRVADEEVDSPVTEVDETVGEDAGAEEDSQAAVNESKRKFESSEENQPMESEEPSVKKIKALKPEEGDEFVAATMKDVDTGTDSTVAIPKDPLSTPFTSSISLSDSPLLQSPAFFRGLTQYLKSNGGIEYQETVQYILSGLESTLLAATSTGTSSLPPSIIAQFLLDLPVLPNSVWDALTRYLSDDSSFTIGLLALRALLLFRPPAASFALQLLLDTVQFTTDALNRQRCVQLAVNLVRREAQRKTSLVVANTDAKSFVPKTEVNASEEEFKSEPEDDSTMKVESPTAASSATEPATLVFETTPSIVSFALEQSEAIANEAFLADLPPIVVNIVVPPEPVYDEIQLPPEASAVKAQQGGDTEMKDASSPAQAAQSRSAAGDHHIADGESLRDEARVREIQSLIAEAQRRKKEFEKLTLRRALLVKEKEVMDRQSAEREEARTKRIQHHLALFFALIMAHGSLPLYSHLFKIYRGSQDSARRYIHGLLPDFVANIGPAPALLAAMKAQHHGAEPAVLHILQLLCGNTVEPKKGTDRAVVNPMVTQHSPVFALCWMLYSMRGGDARFIVPIAPILAADQVKRALHRIVVLPAMHLKVAIQRVLKPHQSIAAKGSKLQAMNVQPITPAELIVHIHRIDQQRKAAMDKAAADVAQNAAAAAMSDTTAAAAVKMEDSEQKSAPVTESAPAQAAAPSASVDLSSASSYPSDDNVWLKSLIGACQQCYSHMDLYTPPAFAAILNALKEDRPLARLFMRTMIQALQLYPTMAPFVLEIAVQCTRISSQIIEQNLLFEGLTKLLSMTLPNSVTAIAAMPDPAVHAILREFAPGSEPPMQKRGAKLTPQQQVVSALVQFVRAQPMRVRPSVRDRVGGTPMSQPQQQPPQGRGWTHVTVQPQSHPPAAAAPHPAGAPARAGGWTSTVVPPK